MLLKTGREASKTTKPVSFQPDKMKATESTRSPFDFVKQIRAGKPLTADEMKDFNPFLMTKLYYYAGHERVANFFNLLWILPKEMQYKLFCVFFKDVWPKGWIKSTKQKEPNLIEVEYLKKVYKVSTKVATEYLTLLTEEDRKEIRRRYE
jgi:hypothetical protein